jgi:hypothetical protein
MLISSWKLTLLTVVLIPMLVVVSQIYGKLMKRMAEGIQDSVADATKVVISPELTHCRGCAGGC